jgi:hypothetical protein
MNNTTKILIYAGLNAINAARQIGIGLGGQAARTALYKTALSVEVKELRGLRNGQLLLDNEHSKQDESNRNKIVLKLPDYWGEIEFIGAKINVQKQNKIVETELVNRAGKVKEFIQQSDYNITINGQLFSQDGMFPYDELDLLNYILSQSTNINVASRYLKLFGINKMVFKSATFDQNQLKYFNVMPFSLSFVSDMDYDFLVED